MPPLTFLGLLKWLDGRPLLDVIPLFWQTIIVEALYTFRPDGSPQFNRTLWGMAKKNMKTLMLMLTGMYKLLAWHAAGAERQPVLCHRHQTWGRPTMIWTW